MASITIEFDPNSLGSYEDEYLAMLWHVAQANPADGFDSEEPGELVQAVGWEIIRRWLRQVPPAMYHHQQRHYHWHQLAKVARWDGTAWVPKAPSGSAHGDPDLREHE